MEQNLRIYDRLLQIRRKEMNDQHNVESVISISLYIRKFI